MSMRDQILNLLQDAAYQPVNDEGLAKLLGLKKKQRSSLLHALRGMLASQELVLVQGDRFRLQGKEGEITGKILFRSQGQALVLPEEGTPKHPGDPAIAIEANDTGTALPGDRVAVRLLPGEPKARRDRESGKRSGRVLRVLERARTAVVGTLQKSGRSFVLVADDPSFPPVLLDDPVTVNLDEIPGLGDKLVVSLEPWNDRGLPLRGRIQRRLGRQFEPGAELLGVFEKFGLDRHFPKEVEREARALPSRVREEDLVGRTDFRTTPTFTIDPDDAKDFDDALSLEPLPGGSVRVGVHIADVSTYVRPGSALDREARLRGNSTYLVGTVVPMLPEKLSNGLCSLVEGEDRLTLAVLFTFTRAGRIQDCEFARTVICSQKRLSYRQAQALLFLNDFDEIRSLPGLPGHQTGTTGRPLASLSDLELVDLQSWLRKLWALAKKLRTDRMKHGSLDLDMPETKIFVDAEGYAERLVKITHDESHQLIEEFMLAANEAVARLTRSQKLPSLYRVHDEPDERKLAEFREFAGTFGLVAGDLTRREEMAELISASERHPQGYLIRTQLLRSLKRACYRHTHDGHYGLHKKDYTHFTSPIRRYADLVVHRVLCAFLAKSVALPEPLASTEGGSTGENLCALSDQLSDSENKSQEAERESFRIKLLEFFERELTRKPRTVFRAVITEIRQGGLFVELVDSMTFGFVPSRFLRGDAYEPNASRSALVGLKTKHHLNLGAFIELEVASVDRYRRLIDFRPTSD